MIQTPGNSDSGRPCVGIIMLDTRFPRIRGDIGNPDTFDFPVRFSVVKGANPDRIVHRPDPSLIAPFIQAGQTLIQDGAVVITTSCGFLSLFHTQLTRALTVPVFSSSLLQIPLARAVISPRRKVGIITASRSALTPEHLSAIGIDGRGLVFAGMEHAPEFSSVFLGNKPTLDQNRCAAEMQAATEQLVRQHPDVGAIVLECTNMPPYARVVREAAGGLPVFDAVTMINHAWRVIQS
ncbi:MAG: aspartate/glutamate racemase family protein [Desulfotignum sp.]